MRIVLAYKGDTLIISPLVKRERLPPIYELVVEDDVTYAITADICNPKMPPGTIPAGYRMVSKDKYSIVFKTDTPPKRNRSFIKSLLKNKKCL